MTSPDELQRAVERLTAVSNVNPSCPGWIVARQDDLRLLLSERAELLATVERMRVALQPFAEVAEEFSVCGDGQPISIKAASGKSDLNVGHLRRAAEAAK